MVEGLGQGPGDDGLPPPSRATIFVADPSAEAERIAQLLRSVGYLVVDVPTSMLVARIAVQTPHVIIMDADAEGAAEAVARIREVAAGGGVHILFLGDPATVVPEPERASAAFFARPVDASDLVRKIDVLTGGPSMAKGPPVTAGGAADPLTPADLRAAGDLGHPPSMSASSAPPKAPVSAGPPPGSTPPREAPLSARAGRRSVSIQAPLCSEASRRCWPTPSSASARSWRRTCCRRRRRRRSRRCFRRRCSRRSTSRSRRTKTPSRAMRRRRAPTRPHPTVPRPPWTARPPLRAS